MLELCLFAYLEGFVAFPWFHPRQYCSAGGHFAGADDAESAEVWMRAEVAMVECLVLASEEVEWLG